MWEQIVTLSFMSALLAATVRMALPLLYAGLGETFLEKTGILNIGLEGVMISGAFFSYAAAVYSGSLWMGVLAGAAGGVVVSCIHGFLCITLKQNQSVSGIALNMFMIGVTGFLYKIMSAGQSYQQIETFKTLPVPLLSQVPLLGNALFNQDILTYLMYLMLAAAFVFYKKTGLGLAFTAAGEYPRAADAAGIPVFRFQWIGIGVNGVLGGIGGAVLVLVQLGKFTENMISGRGYIALAAVILGKHTPIGMFGAALLFGAANALQIRLQALGIALPPQALAMLPYIITLITLLGSVSKSSEPAGLGIPYIRGAR